MTIIATPFEFVTSVADFRFSAKIEARLQKLMDRNTQYLRQLRKAQGGLRGMNTAQAGDSVEHLGQ